MAGHNKWSQIKHKKAKEDSKRGQAFTKLIKEITVAARAGGGDPQGNAHLRSLLEKAKYINMPVDNAQRAIKRGTGDLPGVQYEQYLYEGYGPHGVAIIIDTLSDNKNRTVADIRHTFHKHGGQLGEGGSVSWMFEHKGVVRGATALSEDDLFEKLLDFDIDDLHCDEGMCCVTCSPKMLDTVRKAVEAAGATVEVAELEWVAKTPSTATEEQAGKVMSLLSELHDHDDVKNVFTNLG